MAKLSIFSWFSYPLPIEERLRLIRQAGFDASILWWDGDDRFEQPDMVRRLGLEIENIHAPFENANDLWTAGAGGDQYLAMLQGCVEDSARFGIPTVVVHIAGFEEMPQCSPIGLDRISRLVDLAERKSVNLAFENLNYLPPLTYVFDNLQSDRLGFCFDSGHEHCSRPSTDYLAQYGDKLFAVHLADNLGNADTHLLPYDGTINWDLVKTRLQSSRPLDYLSLEVSFHPYHPESKIYQDLSAEEYLSLAYKRVSLIRSGLG